MKEINLLDKSVYNRIAAGEVVERPLSIVKELIENSIDAGATAVSIDIRNGGMTRISVSDNGKGISPGVFMNAATEQMNARTDIPSATAGACFSEHFSKLISEFLLLTVINAPC